MAPSIPTISILYFVLLLAAASTSSIVHASAAGGGRGSISGPGAGGRIFDVVGSSTSSWFHNRRRNRLSSPPSEASTELKVDLLGQDDSCKHQRRPQRDGRTPLSVPQRGGATAAVATTAIKTMTSRQYEAFNLLSGGVAGTVASCLTNPLEVVKTQLQQSNLQPGMHNPVEITRRILQQDGLSGFFRGLPPTLIGIIPSRSAYFYAYQRVKHFLGNHQRVFHMPEGSPPNALVAGFLAGIAGNTLTNPIWMVRTRMQLSADAAVGQQLYTGYGHVISSIWRQEGIGGFYKGILASYWGCTEGAAQFLLYEQFKTKLLRRENQKRAALGLPPTADLTRAQYFWSAALAKMLASIATYPHEVARTRLREQARSGIFKYHGMWQTLSVIAAEEGTKSLYAGLGVHLMKVVPNSAFMFLTYEIVRKWLSEYTIVEEDNAGKSLQPPLVALSSQRPRRRRLVPQ